MRRKLAFCFALLLGSAPFAAADPVVFNTATLTTSGFFDCWLNLQPCSASGSRVTLGTGDGAVTLQFTGLTTTVPIMNDAVPIALGTISTFSEASVFPSGRNANVPILSLNLTLTHGDPIGSTVRLPIWFGPGGGELLNRMQGPSYLSIYPGPVPPGYGPLVYTLSPGSIGIPINGSVALSVDAGVVPEPGTLLLVGSALALGYGARKRRRRTSSAVLPR